MCDPQLHKPIKSDLIFVLQDYIHKNTQNQYNIYVDSYYIDFECNN